MDMYHKKAMNFFEYYSNLYQVSCSPARCSITLKWSQIATGHLKLKCSKGARRRLKISCSGSHGDKEELRKQKKALEALLRLSEKAVTGEVRSAQAEEGAQPVLKDLPLWRIQTATLPGSQALYHIHVPHYTSMFGELLDRPKPHRFGHMLLPGGSVNLGNPAFELRPGTSAPLVGTLMEVVSHLWLEDGRLLVLAVGLCRIKVVQQLQSVPHSRADVEVLPDLEEVQDRMQLAMHTVDAISGSSGADVSAVMQSAHAAATAAASASSLAWCDYEVAALLKLANRPPGEAQAPGPAALGANKMFDPYKLIWRQLLAGMHGLKSGLGLGMSVGQDEIVDLPHLKDPESAEGREGMELVVQASTAAEAAAAQAAAAAAALALGQTELSPGLPDLAQAPLNTVSERGINCRGPSKLPEDYRADTSEQSLPSLPQACADALKAELRVWRLHSEISELALLTDRIFSVPEVLLPPAVMQLDPRSPRTDQVRRFPATAGLAARIPLAGAVKSRKDSDTPEAASSSSIPPTDAEAAGCAQLYPALRRASRLSFCLATALPTSFDGAEGRQAVLEASSIATRLSLLEEVMQKQKDRLSMLHALEKDFSDDGQAEAS